MWGGRNLGNPRSQGGGARPGRRGGGGSARREKDRPRIPKLSGVGVGWTRSSGRARAPRPRTSPCSSGRNACASCPGPAARSSGDLRAADHRAMRLAARPSRHRMPGARRAPGDGPPLRGEARPAKRRCVRAALTGRAGRPGRGACRRVAETSRRRSSMNDTNLVQAARILYAPLTLLRHEQGAMADSRRGTRDFDRRALWRDLGHSCISTTCSASSAIRRGGALPQGRRQLSSASPRWSSRSARQALPHERRSCPGGDPGEPASPAPVFHVRAQAKAVRRRCCRRRGPRREAVTQVARWCGRSAEPSCVRTKLPRPARNRRRARRCR